MSYLAIADEMKKFEKEIEDNREKYKELQKTIKSILGETDYKGIYGFFTKLLVNEELNFLVIMSRRCLVLCQIFIIFFIMEKQKIHENLIILSDKAIPFYGKTLKGKVAVADDILIHGRTITKMYKLLKRYDSEMNIHIYGYDKDIAIDCLNDELKEITTVETVDYKSEWRNLSNKIVRCIYASNVPYTSFVTSFCQHDTSAILDRIKTIDSIKIIENTDESQKKEGLSSYYCYEEKNEGKGYEKLLLAKGIRLYWNENVKKMTIIPYVFIKRMLLEDAEALLKKIAEIVYEKYPSLYEVLLRREHDPLLDFVLTAYKMRLLTCLFSRAYWMNFIDRYNIEDDFSIDVDTLEKSFGQGVAKDIIRLELEDALKLLSVEIELKESEEVLDEEVIGIWEKCQDQNGKMWIRRYFQKAWYEDERKALANEERGLGISIDYILKTFENKEECEQEILATLVNIWDMGIAAANFAVDEQSNSVSCYNAPGEQSYRIILERYPYIFSYLIAVSKLINKGDAEKKYMEFKVYRKNKLIELLDEFNTNQKIEDYDDIKNIIEAEDGYLNAWNQVDIIRQAKQFDSRKNLKEIVNEFVNNKI